MQRGLSAWTSPAGECNSFLGCVQTRKQGVMSSCFSETRGVPFPVDVWLFSSRKYLLVWRMSHLQWSDTMDSTPPLIPAQRSQQRNRVPRTTTEVSMQQRGWASLKTLHNILPALLPPRGLETPTGHMELSASLGFLGPIVRNDSEAISSCGMSRGCLPKAGCNWRRWIQVQMCGRTQIWQTGSD